MSDSSVLSGPWASSSCSPGTWRGWGTGKGEAPGAGGHKWMYALKGKEQTGKEGGQMGGVGAREVTQNEGISLANGVN